MYCMYVHTLIKWMQMVLITAMHAIIINFDAGNFLIYINYDRHTRILLNNMVVIFEIFVFFWESLILGRGKK